MNIGIIGGGITGLIAAYELGKHGYHAIIFEESAEVGGQVATFKVGGEWLENFYHHIFTTDTDIIALIDELGLTPKLEWLESSVGLYYHGKTYNFVTPMDLIRFPKISLIDRVRLGLTSLRLQRHKDWHDMENISAKEWIIKHAGKRNYAVVWEPLLRGKFGERADEVGMVWLWARIFVRLNSRDKSMRKERLGYMKGSYREVINALAQQIKSAGGEIHINSPVKQIIIEGNRVTGIETAEGVTSLDKIISTIPSFKLSSITPQLPNDYKAKLNEVQYQATVCLSITLKQSLSRFYWINIGDASTPFVAVIEHTNFINRERYGGKHIVYLANYLPKDSPLYQKDAKGLLEHYLPYLKKINPEFQEDWVEDCYLWKDGGAQPIIGTNYSRQILDYKTPIEGLYLANTTQIYPEDRGMNYSVRLGNHISKLVAENIKE